MSRFSKQLVLLTIMLSMVFNPALAAVICGLGCQTALETSSSPMQAASSVHSANSPCHDKAAQSSVKPADAATPTSNQVDHDSTSSNAQTLLAPSDASTTSSDLSIGCDCPNHCSAASLILPSAQLSAVADLIPSDHILEPVNWVHTAHSANPLRPPIA